MRDYLVIGLNHKTAPIEVREKLSFPSADLKDPLEKLTSLDHVEEGVILSTCNRVEVYAATPDKTAARRSLSDFLTDKRNVVPSAIEPHLYSYDSLQAVNHLFRVASSLDSMVVGETQITGQVKKAYQAALACRSSGSYLNRLLNRALYVAKKVRTETGISRHPVSVGQAGVSLAEKIFDDLSQKRVALIGAGKVGGLVLEALQRRGTEKIIILNRTVSRAAELAGSTGVDIASLDCLMDTMCEVDMALTSVEGPSYVLNQTTLRSIMKKRKNRPLFLIDLGVPRNMDPAIGRLPNVYLYNIDDLQKVVEAGLAARQEEARIAEEIIKREATQFYERIVSPFPALSPVRASA